MITPQEISDKVFVKAVFGGYDMTGVDDFLEAVSSDYSALYKENAILKGKLKVLVEKVEEYRSTEDAMRMALLTAQKMGEEITIEANKQKEETLRGAELEVQAKLAETEKRVGDQVALVGGVHDRKSQAVKPHHVGQVERLEVCRRAAVRAGGVSVQQAVVGRRSQPVAQAVGPGILARDEVHDFLGSRRVPVHGAVGKTEGEEDLAGVVVHVQAHQEQ